MPPQASLTPRPHRPGCPAAAPSDCRASGWIDAGPSLNVRDFGSVSPPGSLLRSRALTIHGGADPGAGTQEQERGPRSRAEAPVSAQPHDGCLAPLIQRRFLAGQPRPRLLSWLPRGSAAPDQRGRRAATGASPHPHAAPKPVECGLRPKVQLLPGTGPGGRPGPPGWGFWSPLHSLKAPRPTGVAGGVAAEQWRPLRSSRAPRGQGAPGAVVSQA